MQGGERDTGRQMYIGIDASKGAREVINQIRMAQRRGVTGIAVFSFTDADNSRIWPLLLASVFSERSSVPAMPWKRAGTR